MFDGTIIDGGSRNVKAKAALEYARMGYYVIPLHNPLTDGKCSCGDPKCNHVGKHPRINDWTNKCSTDKGIIGRWWVDWPDANIGIVAGKSGLVVVDVDERHGGYQSFRYLKNRGDLGQFLISLTGNGFHLIYKKNGISFKNVQNFLHGIDIRGDNGFFVVPPSLHASGKEYKFKTPISETEIGNIPDWLVDEITKKKPNSHKPSTNKKLNIGDSDILKGVPYGQRDDTIFKYACKKRDQGLGYEEVKILLLKAASNCIPPLEEKEVIKCLDSSWGYLESNKEDILVIPSFAEIAVKKIFKPPCVVPEFLPLGATILAGDPKIGKSWMALDIALAVATGGTCLGKFTVGGDGSGVLYLALEDDEADFQDRLWKINPHSPFPERAFFTNTWSRAPKGLEDLRNFLEANPDTRLVVVDCLEAIREPQKPGSNSYTNDYTAIQQFREIAIEYSVSILIIHHVRKAAADNPLHRVSGTQGLTGASDQSIILDGIRNTTKVKLNITGRKMAGSNGTINFDKDRYKWMWMSYEEVMSEQRAAIIQVLKEEYSDSLTPKQIAEITGQKYVNVRQLLLGMVRDGQVVKGTRGRYTIRG